MTVFATNTNTCQDPGYQVGEQQQEISITDPLALHHLSDLHLPGGDVGQPPGGGAGDHEEALPGEEEVPGDDGHLSGRLIHYHCLRS